MLLVSKYQPLELPCLIIYHHSSSDNLFMSAITPKQVVYFCGCLQLQLSHSLYRSLLLPLHPWQASCLCGSAPCLLCGCCPSSNNSTITRLVFSFFLLMGTFVSVIMILPGMETQLRKVRPLLLLSYLCI